MRRRRDGADIDDAQQRVARGFDPYELRPRRSAALQRRRIALVDEIDGDLSLSIQARQQPECAAITVVRSEDARAVPARSP